MHNLTGLLIKDSQPIIPLEVCEMTSIHKIDVVLVETLWSWSNQQWLSCMDLSFFSVIIFPQCPIVILFICFLFCVQTIYRTKITLQNMNTTTLLTY